jgi:hypothetical protein
MRSKLRCSSSTRVWPGLFGHESNLDLGREIDARVGFPVGADLERDHEAFGGLPDAHVPNDDVGAVFAPRVPASADVGLDERLRDRRPCRSRATSATSGRSLS